MAFTAGLALVALTIAMVVVARPRQGEAVPFLRGWVVGQFYVMAAMASAVTGVALLIANR